MVAEIVVSHALLVNEITATFDEVNHCYSDFCAITGYRLGLDELDDLEPEAHMLLKGFDAHVRTKTPLVY